MSTATKCKTKYLAKSAILYTVVSAGLLLSAKMLFAQETSSRTIIISPPTINETFDPGDKKEGRMKITNSSETDTITFKAVIRDFIVEDTQGTPVITAELGGKTKYAASSWVGVYPSTFTLAPGQTQNVSYYVQVPEDARPGGRYAAVVYEPQERIDVKGTGTGVETHIGSLFVFRISGDIVENATVSQFSTEKSFWEYGPVTVNTQIQNSSDSHIRPQGTIVIKNLLGQTVASAPLDEHNIFPEASRDFITTLGGKFMVGPHTAELQAKYGEKMDKTLFATTSFFVLPWKIAGILLLVIIAIILAVLFMKKKKSNKKIVPPADPQPATPAQPAT